MSAVINPPRKRGRPTKSEMETKALAKEEGSVFMSSTGRMVPLDRTVDLKLLLEYRRNPYMGKILENRRRLVFTEKYEIVVFDDKGDIRPDLQKYLMTMLDRPGVKLWNFMKIAEDDKFVCGMSMANPIWEQVDNRMLGGKTLDLVRLRRLPPETFCDTPRGKKTEYAEFLKGVTLSDNGVDIEYWQTDFATNKQVQIKNIIPIKDPNSPYIAGMPECLPLVNLITMAKFVWNAQMQRVNRVGSPLLFLKINKPTGDDIAYGQALLENWGKDTAYQLRENFELVDPHISDTNTCEDTIDILAKMIGSYHSPATLISKDGSVMNASSAPEQQLLQAYIRGIHSDIEDTYEPILQTWLDINGFTGFSVEIRIPSPDRGVNEVGLRRADVSHKTQCALPNEKREMVGLPPLDQKGLDELKRYYQEDVGDIPNTANHGSKQVIGSPQMQFKNKNESGYEPGSLGRMQKETQRRMNNSIRAAFEGLLEDDNESTV